jgi:hypothetical protein
MEVGIKARGIALGSGRATILILGGSSQENMSGRQSICILVTNPRNALNCTSVKRWSTERGNTNGCGILLSVFIDCWEEPFVSVGLPRETDKALDAVSFSFRRPVLIMSYLHSNYYANTEMRSYGVPAG